MNPLLTPRPEVIWDDVDGVLRICDTASGQLYSLNGTAALIWSTGTAGGEAAVLDRLCARHPDQRRSRLAADLAEFVHTLGPLLEPPATVTGTEPDR